MEKDSIIRLKNFESVIRRFFDSVKNRDNINNLNSFSLENTVLINDIFIKTLFPLYIHHEEGVRSAIEYLNNLPNSNSGDGLALVYSKRVGEFYLLFKSLQSFVDVLVTIHEELKKEYTSLMYASQ